MYKNDLKYCFVKCLACFVVQTLCIFVYLCNCIFVSCSTFCCLSDTLVDHECIYIYV